MSHVTYEGSRASIEVSLPTRTVRAARGESIEVTPEEASILEKLADWTAEKPKSKPRKPAPTKSEED